MLDQLSSVFTDVNFSWRNIIFIWSNKNIYSKYFLDLSLFLNKWQSHVRIAVIFSFPFSQLCLEFLLLNDNNQYIDELNR